MTSPPSPPAPASAADALVPGALRASKGAWLFRPDALDVLWRVAPLPPSASPALSTPVRARLVVLAARVRRSSSSTKAATPRTGVPARLVGPVVAGGGATLVVDVGVPLVVDGVVGAFAVGDVVEVDVDEGAGLRCIALA
jgi:hypothetical protein